MPPWSTPPIFGTTQPQNGHVSYSQRLKKYLYKKIYKKIKIKIRKKKIKIIYICIYKNISFLSFFFFSKIIQPSHSPLVMCAVKVEPQPHCDTHVVVRKCPQDICGHKTVTTATFEHLSYHTTLAPPFMSHDRRHQHGCFTLVIFHLL